MDFAKLKEMLSGVPSDPAEADAVKQKNQQSMMDMMEGASNKEDQALSPGGMAERLATKKTVDDVGNNVAGMMGGIKSVGTVPAEMAETAAGKFVNSIQSKLASGEPLAANEATALAKIRQPQAALGRTITTEAMPVRDVNIGDKFGNMQKMLQEPAAGMPRNLNLPESSGPVDPEVIQSIRRKLSGNY